MIIIVFGLPGSGKTYFAQRLAPLLNAAYLSSDRLRKQLLAHPAYTTEEKLSVYALMLDKMEDAVRLRKKMVIDATFHLRHTRWLFMQRCRDRQGPIFIEIVADEALVKERLQTPRPDSDADFSIYKVLKSQWQPLDTPHLVIHSTNTNLPQMLRIATEYLDQYDKTSSR